MGENGFEAARAAGRLVGADPDCGAWLCPVLPGRLQACRDAWLVGFSEGRLARTQSARVEQPAIQISLAAFRKAAG